MANLKKEYTDMKDNKHKVEHHTVANLDDNSKERIIEELYRALTKQGKRTTA